MCDPVTLSMSALAIASASEVANVFGQQQMYKANARNAANAFQVQNSQTNASIQQNEAAAGLKAQQSQVEMLKAAATAKASAGESGTSGNSVNALIDDFHS